MNYLHEILWYLTLPLTIVISYYSVLFGLKKFNKLIEADGEQKDATE
ncbi:MAG: hypothetical protein N4A71_12510 [Carboxylicivirga sp.]|jgi:hypothetical protein|nr:hypothetical protein [Carboxylicivirga sp.]MCT4647037.1 hypothetical protein [Carboxylicivirga sp.]